MIQASLSFDGSGCLRRLLLTGHAGFSLRGTDVVCAAVTILVRTFVRALEARDGVVRSAMPSGLGDFHLDLPAGAGGDASWFRGLSDSLLVGLADVTEEYPGHCALVIDHYSEE